MTKNTTPEPFSCLDVAVAAPVKETFLYAVPESLKSLVRIGSRVRVPLGRRRVTGYVVKTVLTKPGHDLKEIEDLLDPNPLFHR
ncbi:MAG: primosomal protein N', partial [Deltaproteobacteria bacterium]|nr:primosomal protein N' [Deltaproteobacteria bacterium]